MRVMRVKRSGEGALAGNERRGTSRVRRVVARGCWRGVSSRALVIASRIPGSFLSLSRRTIISSVYPVR
eukprot:1580610-Prymnesium_polylepis.1